MRYLVVEVMKLFFGGKQWPKLFADDCSVYVVLGLGTVLLSSVQ